MDNRTTQAEAGRPTRGRWSVLNLRFAWHGIKAAWREEGGFRNHVVGALGMVVLLTVIRPEAIWWALGLLSSAILVALELVNCAVERVIDHVDDRFHPNIKLIKDMSAAAVVVASFGVLLMGITMLLDTFELIG